MPSVTVWGSYSVSFDYEEIFTPSDATNNSRSVPLCINDVLAMNARTNFIGGTVPTMYTDCNAQDTKIQSRLRQNKIKEVSIELKNLQH